MTVLLIRHLGGDRRGEDAGGEGAGGIVTDAELEQAVVALHYATKVGAASEIILIDQSALVCGGCIEVIDNADFLHILRAHQKITSTTNPNCLNNKKAIHQDLET